MSVVIVPDFVWFAWATGHHQGIKPEGLYTKTRRKKGRIDPAQRAVLQKQNAPETAQNVKGVGVRLLIASIPNPLSPAG